MSHFITICGIQGWQKGGKYSYFPGRVPTAFLNCGYIESYSLFLYPQCIAAYGRPHRFWGYRPNIGGKKPSAEGKWECCQDSGKYW